MKRLPGSEESKDLCYGLFTMSDSDLEHLVNLSHSFLICKLQGANPLLGASIQIDQTVTTKLGDNSLGHGLCDLGAGTVFHLSLPLHPTTGTRQW